LKSDPLPNGPPASIEVRAGVYWGRTVVTQEIPVPTQASADPTGEAGAAGASGAGGAGEAVDATAVHLVLSEDGSDVLLEIAAPITEGTIRTGVAVTVNRIRIE